MLHMLFYFFNKVLHRKTKPNNKASPLLEGREGRLGGYFALRMGMERGGEKGKKKKVRMQVRDDSSYSQISYMIDIKVCIFINFPNFPNKKC
jgi:hypothetical protein